MGKKQYRLASGELEILEMLWREGPVSLSQAHCAVGQSVGYTTIQTRLERLVKKKLVRKSKRRPAEYQARISQSQVYRADLETLLQRVSDGKVLPLVAHLIQNRNLSSEEINTIRQMVNDAEKRLENDVNSSNKSTGRKHD